MDTIETRTFKSGDSVALLLPEALAIGPGEPMLIERNGDVLTIRRAPDPEAERHTVDALLAALARLPVPDDGIQPRFEIEAPERPGI